MIVLRGYLEPLYLLTKDKQVLLSVDGKEYIILHKGAGVDLVDLLGNYVEVSSTLVESEKESDDTPVIFVRNYKILGE